MNSSNKYKFLLMWDCKGLEYIYDLGSWERRKVWDALKGVETTDNPARLQVLLLRARYNSHRHYEIYILETTDIDKETIIELFQSEPQRIVDLIRQYGHKLHSDRVHSTKAVIV